jgi:GH24 family phage-related lysozyme (muramidase)
MADTYNAALLIEELSRDEGRRDQPYIDTTAHISIGVGRNLTARGLRDDEIDLLLANDIAECERDLDLQLAWWRTLDPVRQRVMLNLCFNLGITKLRLFVRMLIAAKQGRFVEASAEMGRSVWATQVGERAKRLQLMMELGYVPDTPVA